MRRTIKYAKANIHILFTYTVKSVLKFIVFYRYGSK